MTSEIKLYNDTFIIRENYYDGNDGFSSPFYISHPKWDAVCGYGDTLQEAEEGLEDCLNAFISVFETADINNFDNEGIEFRNWVLHPDRKV